MTSSLSGFLGSIILGTFVVIVTITIALVIVSRIDPLTREDN